MSVYHKDVAEFPNKNISVRRTPNRLAVRLAVFESDSSPSLLHSCRSMLRQSQLETKPGKGDEGSVEFNFSKYHS